MLQLKIVVHLNMPVTLQRVHVILILVNLTIKQLENAIHFMIGVKLPKEDVN